MKQTVRRNVLAIALILPLLAGCAGGDACEGLMLETAKEPVRPLVLPEGARAPVEGGEFRIPDAGAAAPAMKGGCLAEPPMTLPPEMLKDPEDDEESGAE